MERETNKRAGKWNPIKACIIAAALASASLCLGGCGRAGLTGGEKSEILAAVDFDSDSAAVSVSRIFIVPAGQQGILTADYRQEGGTAGITVLKGEEEIAALDIPERAENGEKSADGEAEAGHGMVETVLDCGIYTVKVEAGKYRGSVRCVLVRREKRDAL